MIDIQKEIIVALIFAVVYIFIFLIGETVRKRLSRQFEISRKIVHLLGGFVALSFPYVVSSHWTVLVLAVSFCLIVIITKRKGLLKSVHGVERRSYGGIYYPLAIYLIFLMSSNRPVIYFTSILVMTVSDTLAALVGGKYGTIKFDVEGNLKSLEGSVVFFFVTFLCIHLPLLLATDIARIDSVLIAFIIAVLVTGFEAISLSGSDNLIVPFGTYFILTKMTQLPHTAIMQSLYFLIGAIIITVVLFIRLRLFKLSGLIAMMLLNYAALSLCNIYWFLPLLLAQVFYYFLMRIFVHYEGVEKVRGYQVKVIFYLGIIPTFLIFAANAAGKQVPFYLPYLASITAQMAIISNYFFSKYVSRPFKAEVFFKHHRKILEFTCSLVATLCVAVIPIMLYKKTSPLHSTLIVMAGTWIAYTLNFMMNKYYRGVKDDIFEYRRRFVSASLGVACVFLLQKIIAG